MFFIYMIACFWQLQIHCTINRESESRVCSESDQPVGLGTGGSFGSKKGIESVDLGIDMDQLN